MTDVGIRIRVQQRLALLALSMRKASLQAGLGESFLRDYLRDGSQMMRVENLVKLADVLQTNPAWLLTGAGEAEVEDPTTAEVISILPKLRQREREAVVELARLLVLRRTEGDYGD